MYRTETKKERVIKIIERQKKRKKRQKLKPIRAFEKSL